MGGAWVGGGRGGGAVGRGGGDVVLGCGDEHSAWNASRGGKEWEGPWEVVVVVGVTIHEVVVVMHRRHPSLLSLGICELRI